MSADGPLNDIDGTADTAPTCWRAALDRITARAGRWQQGRRLTISSPDYIEPRPFCDQLLSEALSDRRFLKVSERAAFFDWACSRPGRRALVPILAGYDLLARGDRKRALRHLDLALAVDQEDLFAQELWFEARGEPVTPVDATRRFCPNPFERIESASRNRMMFCCPAWLPVTVGSLSDESADAVWNSQAAQDVRASIHDGSYRYCSRMHCPMLSNDQLPRVEGIRNPDTRAAMTSKATVIPRKIQRISLAHDRSCNLSCPSCRTKLIIADKAETKRLDALTNKALLPLLLASRRVTITGSGDPFSSRHYRNVIRHLTSLGAGPIIDLQTNGLMLKRSWDELGLEGRAGNVLVSIDAATKQTYEIVRRGGLFEDLLENLEFLSELKRRGAVGMVRLDFVTQARNFREMPEAAEMMRRYGFDQMKFQMLRSWNTWSAEEFERQHVGHPGHPDYGDFRAVLKDQRLRRPDVTFFGFYSTDVGASPSDTRSESSEVFSNGEERQAASRA